MVGIGAVTGVVARVVETRLGHAERRFVNAIGVANVRHFVPVDLFQDDVKKTSKSVSSY